MDSISNIFNTDSNGSQSNFDESSYLYKKELNHIIENDLNLENSETGISSLKKEEDINNNKDLKNNELKQNLLGRKKKKKHSKYSTDNIIRKIKSYFLIYLLNFINKLIDNKYNGNIGQDILEKQLLKIDNKKFSSKYDKQLLNKTLEIIFSENISGIYQRYNIDHNKVLIMKLLKEEDEGKRECFKKLFNLTFIECLKHFRGSEIIEELIGLDSLDNFLNLFEGDKDYQENVKYCINNFEEIIGKKRSQKEKKYKPKN
jgi:hypothetical protein